MPGCLMGEGELLRDLTSIQNSYRKKKKKDLFADSRCRERS